METLSFHNQIQAAMIRHSEDEFFKLSTSAKIRVGKAYKQSENYKMQCKLYYEKVKNTEKYKAKTQKACRKYHNAHKEDASYKARTRRATVRRAIRRTTTRIMLIALYRNIDLNNFNFELLVEAITTEN